MGVYFSLIKQSLYQPKQQTYKMNASPSNQVIKLCQ